jgi:twitching motility protein PilJ
MSVVDQLKNIFSKKSHDVSVGPSGALSLGMPASRDPHNDSRAGMGLALGDGEDSVDGEDGLEPLAVDRAELVTLPLLGRRTAGAHQRILFVLLAISVIVLGTVAGLAVSKSDRAAQQVAGTGQSLMESQRLAKSVSQALVGSAQAFPDVKESASVLARTVRGLKSGDASLNIPGTRQKSTRSRR